MASYTIEDIELIRRKSGISYQEAVALLDYHDGNVTRALIDLERNGKLRPDSETQEPRKDKKSGAQGFFQKLYRNRVQVRKQNTMILNVSWLFTIACILFSPHMTLAALIVSVILGYHISFVRSDSEFAGDDLEAMVRDVANNVKSSMGDLAKGVSQGFAQMSRNESADAAKTESKGSYYQSNPAAASAPRYSAPRTGVDVPTMQVPVKVESQDGDITVETDSDGYGSATIG